MRPRPVSILILALILGVSAGIAALFIWSMQNRVPPATQSAKPMVQGASSSGVPAELNGAPARVMLETEKSANR
ncbi:hypothetical protein FHT02_004291 [Sphingomonas xinjiangensis]|uniref:Uncharacterized protein n=1 Tax=Sphingomonas xinjiangensis TaxID=643568 RepID=A0A840YTI6_9SPHN|nr:hypothetical protein [Sphingomonas xinjiangensis]